MTTALLTDEQREAMQEIANIGMGRAGASMARILGQFVILSIPKIHTLDAVEIPEAITKAVGDEDISAARQAFHGAVRGEAIVLYRHQPDRGLASMMGYDPDTMEEYELILDVTNIMVGACLGGIAEQLGADIGFSAPSIMAEHIHASRLISPEEVATASALFIEINFSLEDQVFACHLIMLMPQDQTAVLGKALDMFIESLGG